MLSIVRGISSHSNRSGYSSSSRDRSRSISISCSSCNRSKNSSSRRSCVSKNIGETVIIGVNSVVVQGIAVEAINIIVLELIDRAV